MTPGLVKMAGATPCNHYQDDIACSWNGSFVPRLRFLITPDPEKCASDLQIVRAAYRNRTDDLRITRVFTSACHRPLMRFPARGRGFRVPGKVTGLELSIALERGEPDR